MNKPKILIVEDQPVISRALQRAVQKLGHAVAGAVTSGEDALEPIKGTVPDLILMDIQLAGKLDGVEDAERIHAQHDVPVIHLTGHTDGQTLQRAR